MAAARKKRGAARRIRHGGPWSAIDDAIASCEDMPAQYELTLKVVVRNNESVREMEQALDDIRAYGSCEITECEALTTPGDVRRLS